MKIGEITQLHGRPGVDTAPRGDYNLGLELVRDGEQYEVAWPFEVIETG